jgi:nitrogen fixation NifU-like protein
MDIMKRNKDKLLEHFLRPRNVGIIENADGYSSVENPINGYRTDIYLKISDGIIKDIKFKTIGCTATIASDSALTDIVKGKNIDEIIVGGKTFDSLMKMIDEVIGKVPEKNWHCPPTAILALLTALKNHYSKLKDNQKIEETDNIIKSINKYFDDTLSKL